VVVAVAASQVLRSRANTYEHGGAVLRMSPAFHLRWCVFVLWALEPSL